MRSALIVLMLLTLFKCNSKKKNQMEAQQKIIFLHHSTGKQIWKGGVNRYIYKLFGISNVKKWFREYNESNGKNYEVTEQYFPKKEPYGWRNYPYDYYNIWVKHGGPEPYMEEPTLEILTKKYDMVIWKHCYPVGLIKEQKGAADINSPEKTIGNYKLQYNALKDKMHQFPNTKFLVWTGATLVKSRTTEEQARRAKEFFDWVREEWDEKGDNIYLWDLYALQTEGGLYFKDEYAESPTNSHPSDAFSRAIYPYFCQRIVDVVEGRGDSTNITGK